MSTPSGTVRLTVAQATVRFLANQWSERDGQRQQLFQLLLDVLVTPVEENEGGSVSR